MKTEETKEIDEQDYNMDDELAEKFRELFEKNSDQEVPKTHDKHSLSYIVKKKEERSAINSFLSRQEMVNSEVEYFAKKRKTLFPIERKRNAGKHFSIIDKAGEKTIVLEVYICMNKNIDSRYYDLEYLSVSEQKTDDGFTRRTFYVDDPQEDGNRFVLYTLSEDKVLINNGILLADELVISKEPLIFRYNNLYDKKANYVINNSGLYDLSLLSDNQIIEVTGDVFGKKTVPARMNSTVFLVDTILQEPVTRKVFYDKESKQWKAEMEIFPYRSYFAFQIRPSSGPTMWPLTNIEIGRYYRDGKRGYQKDLEKAIEYFEKDGSSESLYEIAHIFLDDENVNDIDLALDYLEKSADAGYGKAAMELLLQNLQLGNDTKPFLTRILQMNDNKNAAMLFFKACLRELYTDSFDENETFNWLFSSASDGYKPAQLRISSVTRTQGWNKIVSREDSYKYYINSISLNDGTIEFCFGGMLLFGWKIAEHTQLGIRFLERSYSKGNINALFDLFNYYVENDAANERYQYICKYGNDILKITDDIKELIGLSNTLFDLEPHGTNETDSLAREALNKVLTIDCTHSTALNNLAWSYKKGKGCETDYEKATSLFEKAAEFGCLTSLYHLGDLYYRGLGQKQNIELASQYWKKGAELGNSKCIKAIGELASDNENYNLHNGENGYTFISYSTKNQQDADSVRFLLKENGITCWMAPYDIPAGMEYAGVINRTLERCSCLVLLLSKDSQKSQFVRREVERAVAYNKPIVTIQIEELELVDSFKFYIGESQIVAVRAIDGSSPEMKKIIDGIKSFVN